MGKILFSSFRTITTHKKQTNLKVKGKSYHKICGNFTRINLVNKCEIWNQNKAFIYFFTDYLQLYL